MPVIATAGHVDHGKSELVRALTGIDPDRLAEEKRRGMTIDLGFAHTTTTKGTVLSFVDVPGHADLVRTMIAGASGVDVVMLVIDAREGWKPQTFEHLAVAELLGVGVGVVALTKIDLVDDDEAHDAESRTRALLGTSPIDWVDVVRTSTRSGEGIEALIGTLASAVTRVRDQPGDLNRPRLFIDRVFTMVGAGTVVTGTLDSGTLHVGTTLVSVPGGHRAIVRAIQVHGAPADSAYARERCAVNLAHTTRSDVERGQALVVEGDWHHTQVVDARLTRVVGQDDRQIDGRGLTVHWGTNRQVATVRRIPWQDAMVRIRFHDPLPLSPGDRFILRHTGSDTTVAGGVVHDVAPLRRVSRARPDGSIEAQLESHGWMSTAQARRLTGRDVAPVAGGWVAGASRVATTRARLDELLDAGPVDLVSLEPFERDLIGLGDQVLIEHGTARRSTAAPLHDHPVAASIRAAGITPSADTKADRDIIRRLVRSGAVFEHDGLAFHIDTLNSLLPALRTLWAAGPDGFTVSELRSHLGLTRKHAVPLAECLDKAGFTRRRDDRRVPGPRASTVEGNG